MKLKYIYLFFAFFLLISVEVNGQVATGSILIKNGTVLTITNGDLENTDVLVVNGKITKIGKSLTAPTGTKTIHPHDKFVIPGIINAHTPIPIHMVK